MTNQQGNGMIAAAKPGQINDVRGGAQSSCQLELEPPGKMLAVLAYPATAEPANTALLDGADVAVEITVVQVTDRPWCQPMAITTSPSEFTCSALEVPAGLFGVVSPCTVLLTSSMTHGGTASVLVVSEEGGTSTTVTLTVWFPQQLSVQVADDTLNRIAGTEACASSRYQQTEATAVAVFGGEGLGSVSGIDVTDLVTLEASGSVTLSGSVVYASSPGDASVTVSSASISVTPASLSVVDAAVTAVALQSAVVTEAVWSQMPAPVAWAASTSFAARVQLRQRLRAEGDRGTVEASVLFSDGQTWLVPPDELSVTSSTASLQVQRTPDSRWEVEVPEGAGYACDYLLSVEWRPCANLSLASSIAPVDVRLPSAVALLLTFADPRLTDPDDSAAVSPISVATETRVIVKLRFVESQSGFTTDVDFSFDSRTTVTVDPEYTDCVSYDAGQGELRVHAGATYPIQRCTQASVTATVSSFGFTATASIPIVAFLSLELTLLPFPTFPGADGIVMSTLRFLDCTTCRQLARAHVVADLSDGTQTAVTSGASTTVTVVNSGSAWGAGTAMVDAILTEPHVLRPATPGSVSLEATFNVREGASFTVLISDERTQITEIALTLPSLGSGDYLTFNKYKNTMLQSSVQVMFDDGTQLADASIMNLIPDWCPISSLLLFASDYPEAVPFDVEGGLTLLENHWESVELTASAACNGSSVDDSVKHIYANLLARLDDVDLGQRTGVQFQQYGDTLEVAVRANVQASKS
jgi:hypothetical protein